MTDSVLIGPTDAEKVVLDFLHNSTTFSDWGSGTKTPIDSTPDHFIMVRQVDGDATNTLLYRHSIRLRVWDKSEGVATRAASALIAHLRRGLMARLVSLPVALPDSVDTSKVFYQFVVQIPTIGETQ